MAYTNVALVLTFLLAILNTEAKFTTYWNIYHNKCNKLGVQFDLDQFGIIHNTGNQMFGERSNLIYEPGLFPTIVNDEVINGGLPQNGDIQVHIDKFQTELDGKLKDAYEGILCLDFEQYKPQFQSASMLLKDRSRELIQQENPDWTVSQVQEEAIKRFNESARPYFETLIDMVRVQRPNVLVGYYGFPYCNNYNPPNTECSPWMMSMNDEVKDWMYKKSTVLLPSLYTNELGDGQRMDIATYRTNHLSHEMKETQRVNDYNSPVYPYVNYVFKDTRNLIPKETFLSVLWIIRYYGGDGAIMWNWSSEFDTLEECTEFREYMNSFLGPLLKCMDELPEQVEPIIRGRYPIFEGENSDYTSDPENDAEKIVDALVAEVDFADDDTNDVKAVKVIARFCETL